jgi:hypothetical protein
MGMSILHSFLGHPFPKKWRRPVPPIGRPTDEYIFGAMSIGARPLSHDECQKSALSPRPTVSTIEARKQDLSI